MGELVKFGLSKKYNKSELPKVRGNFNLKMVLILL